MPLFPKSRRAPWLPPKKAAQSGRSADGSIYNSIPWRKLRATYIIAHPLCIECKAQGRTEAATVVDHIIPIIQGGAPMDSSNLQSLCSFHHNQKSGREAHKSPTK